MKKIISLILIVLFISGCGAKKEDFYLTYNGKDLLLDKAFNVSEYGQYNDTFESESCAFGDRDIVYIYDDIEIEAYGDSNGKLVVYSIYFTSQNVQTNEGIALYDLIDDAIKVYGNDYTKDNGKYVYNRNNTSLIFITQDGIIENIEYRLINI